MASTDGYVRWDERPQLRRPILVAAFEGWNDAADAASTAVGHLTETWKARRFAELDAEEFFDFTLTRPRVRLDEDLVRHIDWPINELRAAVLPDLAHDLVLLAGTEPQLRWRTFCSELVGVMRELRVELMVTLGALLADVAHTQPIRVTGAAADAELADRLHLSRSRYEGPTGIVGVLGEAAGRAGIPTASLWAAVPHYVGQTPSPKATLALLERTSALLGVPNRPGTLQSEAAAYEARVSELVQSDPDIAEYVAQLERDEEPELELSSGDSLAAEVERFLRDHGPK